MTRVEDFQHLPPQEQSKWIEWLVAQELFRRQCIAGDENAEAIWFWASKDHEIDFVDSQRRLYEVKVGRSGALEFDWFSRVIPNRKLLVIGRTEFQAAAIKGITIHQFLLADGFPHPYPGQVADPDLYNEYGRF